MQFFSLSAQTGKKIELLNADVSEFDQQINANATRLIGNVAFRHEGVVMNCDSAWLFRNENRLEAFENIRIRQGDSINLTGRRLVYNGDTKQARVFENVELSDRKMILRTDILDYDLAKNIAYYNTGGTIKDAENTLTSRQGYYYSRSKDIYFKTDVLLNNPRYTITSDSLKYNTVSKIAWFPGPAWINSNENKLYSEDGWYNTETQISSFRKNTKLFSKSQTLSGDTLLYNRNTGIGKVYGNVSIYDSTNKVTISGNYGEHHELTDSSWVTGKALMMQPYDEDTLYMHADTLLSVSLKNNVDTSNKKVILSAFHQVKIFKNDLQAICDSLVYQKEDSTIRLYYSPVLWSGMNQLTADSVVIQTGNESILAMYLNNNSFITSRVDSLEATMVDSLKFNQIRGKNMTGWFSENKLRKIDVEGNGQTIYYARNKKDKTIGVNRADCSDLVIFVDENEVTGITLLKEPDGTLFPIGELAISDLRLKGFKWLEKLRPKNREDLLK